MPSSAATSKRKGCQRHCQLPGNGLGYAELLLTEDEKEEIEKHIPKDYERVFSITPKE